MARTAEDSTCGWTRRGADGGADGGRDERGRRRGVCGDDVQIQIDTDPDPLHDAWGFWAKLAPFENVLDGVVSVPMVGQSIRISAIDSTLAGAWRAWRNTSSHATA